MDCEEFWRIWDEGSDQGGPFHRALKTHLGECPACSRDLSVLEQGFLELKREIHEEEGARFWHELRQEVRAGVRLPPSRSRWSFSWPKLAWATAGGLMLLFLVLRSSPLPDSPIVEDDLLLFAGINPEISVYADDDAAADEPDDGETGSDLYRGITDSWTSLFDEVADERFQAHGDTSQPDREKTVGHIGLRDKASSWRMAWG